MILITGAAGKTGRAVLQALVKRGQAVRVMVRREGQTAVLAQQGAAETITGDLENDDDVRRTMRNVRAVYHICPNMHPDEISIGQRVIAAARDNGVTHFVYHSVLFPQIEAMPHHWHKLRVEEVLINSGLSFTILQPCAYMQNLRGQWPQIRDEAVYRVPYRAETRLSLVDLQDVANAAVVVLTEPGHLNAVYPLCGPAAPSQIEVAQMLSQHLSKPVRTQVIDRADWRRQAAANGLGGYAIDTLLKMFAYYDQFDFVGNNKTLEWLLARPSATFPQFIARLEA